MASEKYSAIMEHSKNTGYAIINDNFKIISRCQNKSDIRYLEALHIIKKKPNLNNGLPVDLSIVQL